MFIGVVLVDVIATLAFASRDRGGYRDAATKAAAASGGRIVAFAGAAVAGVATEVPSSVALPV